MITVLYFAWVREQIGTDAETLALPDGVAAFGALMAHLNGLSARHAAALAAPGGLRGAVNQIFARPETPVRDGDEVAIFPPVTGG